MSTSKHSQNKGSSYLPSLDGWRAVAILWVINSHNPPWSLFSFSDRWLRATGDRGVQLFFALSGLLICSRLLDEEHRFGAISLRSFYTRRLFRIQPAALTYLAVISLLMLLGVLQKTWTPVLGSALMVRNIWPRFTYSWETGHFWSLAAEEHFYLFFPGFLVLIRRYRLAATAFLVLAFEVWVRILIGMAKRHGYQLNFLRTDMVIGGILLGCVFALALRRPQVMAFARAYLHPWVALLYTAAVFTRLNLHHSQTDHALIITVYPLLLTATMLHPESLTTRFLELPPLRFLGRISYSLYLWQQLFFDYYHLPQPGTFHSHIFLCWCATFACALASYYWIETPLIRKGHKIARRFDLQTKQETLHPVPTLQNP